MRRRRPAAVRAQIAQGGGAKAVSRCPTSAGQAGTVQGKVARAAAQVASSARRAASPPQASQVAARGVGATAQAGV